MIVFIIYIIGLILCIKAVLEIFNTNGDMAKKLLACVVLVLTSWIGLCVYYFYARERIGEWVR